MGYPQHPPVPPQAEPPVGWGPRPDPWAVPGSPPPTMSFAPPQPPATNRTPVWAWVAIITLLALLIASMIFNVALLNDRNERNSLTAGPSTPTRPATSTSRPTATTGSTASPSSAPSTAPSSSAPATAPTQLDARLVDLKQIAEEIRELRFQTDPTVLIVDDAELRRRLTEANERDLDPARIDAEGQRLGLLAVIPQEIADDYAGWLERLYEEAVGGFYDPTRRELVVPADNGEFSANQKRTVVHELVHALTDQHFSYGPVTERLYDEAQEDKMGAAVAVVEGDAILSELVYIQEYLDPLEAAEILTEVPNTPILDTAPLFIRDMLFFPYLEGYEFVEPYFFDGGRESVNDLYRNLPTTTEQILHGEKYDEGEGAVPVAVPALDLGAGWSKTAESDMGEFVLRLILRDRLDADLAEEAAAGWGGDRYVQYQNGDSTLLALRIVGDDTFEASAMYDAFEEWVNNWNNGGRGASSLTLDGDTITLILSEDPSAVTAAAGALGTR